MIGTVVAFDEFVGLGSLVSDDGTEHMFHCVEIADGSRSIAVGAVVEFVVLAKFGRYEASGLRAVPQRSDETPGL